MAASPWLKAWLRHIPGAVLMAIIAPTALTKGPAETLATLATVLVAAYTSNILLAMVVGMAVISALRLFI